MSPGFAVEFWCLADTIRHASLVSVVTPEDTDRHVLLMELTARDRMTFHYVPYRWQHVVGQIRGDRIELFADGEPAGSSPNGPDHGDVACQLLLGRLTTRPGAGLSIDRPFVGRLDELSLYDHPLSPEEIRAHYRMGRANSGTR